MFSEYYPKKKLFQTNTLKLHSAVSLLRATSFWLTNFLVRVNIFSINSDSQRIWRNLSLHIFSWWFPLFQISIHSRAPYKARIFISIFQSFLFIKSNENANWKMSCLWKNRFHNLFKTLKSSHLLLVYPLESIAVGEKFYHKLCFKCIFFFFDFFFCSLKEKLL